MPIFLKQIALITLVLSFSTPKAIASIKEVYHTSTAPIIDGVIDEIWQHFSWHPIDFVILGKAPSSQDFSGKFKLAWDQSYLYLVAVIQDDVLSDTHPDPKDNYWNDDCLEVFLDPDGSGGDHLYSHNAFAYHIALDNNVVDMGTREGEVLLLNAHAKNQWQRQQQPPYSIIWEVQIAFHLPDLSHNEAIALKANKEFGFMLAYCDADESGKREHFVGSQSISSIDNDKNIGYKTATVFTKMRLAGSK